MNFHLKYEITATTSEKNIQLTLKIPRSFELHYKKPHDIQATFTQILLFLKLIKNHPLEIPGPWIQSIDKIEKDLKNLSQEISWIKSIHAALQAHAIDQKQPD
jgi:hypothetical protein